MKKIVILALLGDPTIPAGIEQTGGFNQTLRELLTTVSAFNYPICVITDTSFYRQERYCEISSNLDLYRVTIHQDEHDDQERFRNIYERIISEICNLFSNDLSSIALIHSFYWESGFLAYEINRRFGTPYIHTPISLSYYKTNTGNVANCQFQVECEPLFLKMADRVLAITEQEKQVLVNHYGIDRTRIVVIGRTVDAVFHSPARDYSGNPRNTHTLTNTFELSSTDTWWISGAFLYIGRIVTIKGLLQIIQAWNILKTRCGTATPPLWIVGGSPSQIEQYRRIIINYVKELPTYEKNCEIVWWGCLDQASISALLLKTNVLVTHSAFEAGGRVILEAMCQGRAVIATPNGFALDLIEDWTNGFLVSYGDIVNLSKRLEHFVRQPFLSCSMGNAAKYTFDRIEVIWDYSNIHRSLYAKYLHASNAEMENRQEDDQRIIFESEHRELINCYPFFDILLTYDEWKKELCGKTGASIDSFFKLCIPNSHARHYTCSSNGMLFRVKQFYNRIKKDALWNINEKKKILSSAEQFQNAAISFELEKIVKPVCLSESGRYYVLNDMQPVESISLQETYDLLNSFSKQSKANTSSILSERTFTLYSKMISLKLSTLELRSKRFERILKIAPKLFAIERKTRSKIRWGINYGKLLRGHVVLQNGQQKLLPTSDLYYGELGNDYIITTLSFGKDVLSSQCFIPLNKKRQALMLACLAWENMLIEEWTMLKSDVSWDYQFRIALEYLRIL